jgi:hypothetical protein
LGIDVQTVNGEGIGRRKAKAKGLNEGIDR